MSGLLEDWSTYDLSNFLLFSPRTYHRLFEIYNAAIWPGQVVAVAAGVALLALLCRWIPRMPWRDDIGRWERVAGGLLASAWLWVALAFHLRRYATISWLAPGFAAAFVVEAVLLALLTAIAPIGSIGSSGAKLPARMTGVPSRLARRAGFGLALLGVALLPLSGVFLGGRSWRQIELFGLTPDPTAVATLGLAIALARGWRRSVLLVVPLLWCAMTGLTLRAMAAPDFWIAPGAALFAIAVWAYDWRAKVRAARAAGDAGFNSVRR